MCNGTHNRDSPSDTFGTQTSDIPHQKVSCEPPMAIPQSLAESQPIPLEGTEKVSIFKDQNGKCLRFITSPSTNRLSKAMLDRKRRVKLRFLRH